MFRVVRYKRASRANWNLGWENGSEAVTATIRYKGPRPCSGMADSGTGKKMTHKTKI